MIKLLLISALVACSLGAPSGHQTDSELTNSQILSEPKSTGTIASTENPIPGPINLQQHLPQIAVDPVPNPVKRDIPVPLSLPVNSEKSIKPKDEIPSERPQIAIDPPSPAAIKDFKRDSPLPNLTTETTNLEVKKAGETTSTTIAPTKSEAAYKPHPATFVHPVPVSELFKDKKKPAETN